MAQKETIIYDEATTIDYGDVPYPAGHNWEGLTPNQVNKAYKKEQPLKKTFPNSATMQDLDNWANENCTEIIHIEFKDKTTEIEYKKK